MTQQMDEWAKQQAEAQAPQETKAIPIPPAKILEPAPGVVDSSQILHKDVAPQQSESVGEEENEDDSNLFA